MVPIMEHSPDTFSAVAERLDRKQPIRAVGHIALTTLSYALPPEEPLYREVRSQWSSETPTQLQPPVKDTLQALTPILEEFTSKKETGTLSTEQLSWFVGTMYQFSDRNGLAEAMRTPFEVTESLHDKIIQQAETAPTTFPQQLRLALEDAPTLPSAVWNLFLTSRQYARWRDTPSLDGAPVLSKDEKLQKMHQWEKAVAAVKPGESADNYQDAAGDTYYVWTHALARIIYGGLKEQSTP